MKQSCGRRASVQPAEGESPRSASRKVIEELFEAIVAGATGPTVEMRHGPITALVSSWTGWSVRETDARLNFPIAAGELIERGLHAKADHVRARAGADLDQIIAAGLRHREGQLLVPVAVVKPELGLDAVTYEMLLEWRRKVHPSPGDGIPDAPCVCEGCTHIFRPRGRKTRAHYALCVQSDRPLRTCSDSRTKWLPRMDGWIGRCEPQYFSAMRLPGGDLSESGGVGSVATPSSAKGRRVATARLHAGSGPPVVFGKAPPRPRDEAWHDGALGQQAMLIEAGSPNSEVGHFLPGYRLPLGRAAS